ncbi:hypothetical protein C0J52_04913 [Blattella germanica]|nr:hypothetical protein C0J52_04913 [Blattella germanica]
MAGTGGRKPRVRDLNAHLICFLCGGYYVDATTIVECLHSFCRSCIVRHLETSKFCPICDVQVHKAKPLHSIRPDRTLQTLAFKVVPGLYQAEMQRRKEFSISNGMSLDLQLDPSFFSSEDSISLSLEYYDSDETDDEEDSETPAEKETEKRKPHLRYLKCPAAVTMRQLKKFIRMKYGLSSEHRVDVIYEEECLRDDFSLMDVAYTFHWKRVAPMRFSYRIFNPPIYVPAPVESTTVLQEQQEEHKKDDQVQQDEQQEQQQESSVSSSHTTPSTENADNEQTDAVDTNGPLSVSNDTNEDPPPNKTPVPDDCTFVDQPENSFEDELLEPPSKKVKLSSSVNKKCKKEVASVVQEETIVIKPKIKLEEKRQKRKRKKSSASDHERRSSRDKEAVESIDTPPVIADVTNVEPIASSPRTDVTKTNEEEQLPEMEEMEKDKTSCGEDSPSKDVEQTEEQEDDEEVQEAAGSQEENEAVEDSGDVGNDNEEAEENNLVTEEGEAEDMVNEDDDNFTSRLSSSEEEIPGEEETRIIKTIEVREDKHVKDVEERKKSKGKREGRKKSKHKSKHHHHQESSTRKRKAHRAEATPTILQYQEDVMKLKVKLGPLKPVVSHRHHHHHHSKHNRKASQEAEVPSTTINLRSNGEPSSSPNPAASTKERLLQMRAVRHKSISNNKSTTPPITNTTSKDDVNGRGKKTEVLMPPSSITVSKVNIGEKRKQDSQKSTNSNGSGTEESKRPSLEIMLVNAPSTATTTATSTTATTPTTTAGSSSSESFVAVRQNSTETPSKSVEHGKSTRPLPPTIPIPLVRIKKTSVTSIRPPSGLTITPKLPTTTSLPTKSSPTITKTPVSKVNSVPDTGGQTKNEVRNKTEEDTAMRHDDIGALDLSGKSSRSKSTSPATSPSSAASFPSPPSPVMKSPAHTSSSTHQSILSIAQSLVHRQLQQQQQHGLLNISSSSSAKVPKSPGSDNVLSGTVASPVYGMSNLKTLSDTAVRIRNEMAAQGDKARNINTVKGQIHQKPAPLSVQMSSSSGTNSTSGMVGRSPLPVAYGSNNNPRTGLSQPPSRSPTNHQQQYSHVMANSSISQLRIPIPPTALSKASSPARASSVPRLHELYPSTQGGIGRGRGIGSGIQNRGNLNNHTKPGPNQAVRHIPNPSALLIRQQQTQNRLQQQQQQQQQNSAAALSRQSAVAKTLFNNFNNASTSVKPTTSTSLVASSANPVSSIRKMENMTRNIEKVAAGLTVRAVEAHSK